MSQQSLERFFRNSGVAFLMKERFHRVGGMAAERFKEGIQFHTGFFRQGNAVFDIFIAFPASPQTEIQRVLHIVIGLVLETGERHFVRKCLIVTVGAVILSGSGHAVKHGVEIIIRVVIGLGVGQQDREDADSDRHIHLAAEADGAFIKPGGSLFRGLDRHEELLELTGDELHRLERFGIVNRFPVLGKAGVDLLRRRTPEIFCAEVIIDPEIVFLFDAVHKDHIFIVEQQFRHQFVAEVAEIVVPCVAVLIPDLDNFQVHIRLRNDFAIFAFQISDRQLDFIHILCRIQQQRTRFKLATAHHNIQRAQRRTVHGVLVRQILHIGKRRNGIVHQIRLLSGKILRHTQRIVTLEITVFFVKSNGFQRIRCIFQNDIRLPEQLFLFQPVGCLGEQSCAATKYGSSDSKAREKRHIFFSMSYD